MVVGLCSVAVTLCEERCGVVGATNGIAVAGLVGTRMVVGLCSVAVTLCEERSGVVGAANGIAVAGSCGVKTQVVTW